MKTNNFLRRRLGESSMKRAYMAKKLGVTERTITNWVNGRGGPKMSQFAALAELLSFNDDDCRNAFDIAEMNGLVSAHIRVLDLRRINLGSPQIVKAYCGYSFVTLPISKKLFFYGATTTGKSISIDHDSASQLVIPKVVTIPKADANHKLTERIEYDCSRVKSSQLDISYTITYQDAFLNEPAQWFHTHLDYQTNRLILTMLFPDRMPVKSIVLYHSRTASHSSEMIPMDINPFFLAQQSLVTFIIEEPLMGFTYEVHWKF